MFLTTTDGIEGYSIVRYLGIIGGEGIGSAWTAGGTAGLHAAIQKAVNGLREGALQAGANAVVGVHINHESTPQTVVAYGTAVFVQPTREPLPVLPPLPPPTEQ